MKEKRKFALCPPIFRTILEIRFQSPKPLSRGKPRVLSKMYVKLSYDFSFIFHNREILPSCPDSPALVVLFRQSCIGVLSWRFGPVGPVLAGLDWQSCPGNHILYARFCLSLQFCSVNAIVHLSCSACPILALFPVCLVPVVLSQLSFPGCPVPAGLARLSCPGCPVSVVLLWLPCPCSAVLRVLCWSAGLVLAVPFRLTSSGCLFLAVLF